MRTTFLFLFLILPGQTQAQSLRAPDPAYCTVKITSHGASGTVISTSQGRSWVLSCAHMFLDDNNNPSPAARGKRIVIDGPAQPHSPKRPHGPPRLVLWDHQLDLSLIEVENGPFFFIPVAPAGFRPGKRLLSAGYDEMRWPITRRTATILQVQRNITITREPPWHGRSGGCLVDLDAGVLIGVVQAYETDGPGGPPTQGIYASHAAILRFLARAWPLTRQGGTAPAQPAAPAAEPPYVPRDFAPHYAPGLVQPQQFPCPT